MKSEKERTEEIARMLSEHIAECGPCGGAFVVNTPTQSLFNIQSMCPVGQALAQPFAQIQKRELERAARWAKIQKDLPR